MTTRDGYHTIAVLATRVVWIAISLAAVGCYSHGQTTCSQEESAIAPLVGKVVKKDSVDAGSGNDGAGSELARTGPGADSLVFVELCDLYSENPNPSKGHPNYRYVALADGDGNFKVDVPKGTIGLHTLLDGYVYGSMRVPDSTSSGIVVNEESLNGRPAPKVSAFGVAPSQAQVGSILSFSLAVQAAPNDPISDEVLLAEPVSGLARAFDPPRRGRPGAGFPDGTWTLSLTAPPPGVYIYYAQAVSEGCAVSARLSAQVTVR